MGYTHGPRQTKCELFFEIWNHYAQIHTFAIFVSLMIQNILNWDFTRLWDASLPTCRILFHDFMKLMNFFKK
jgi:hypothetical protein